MKRSGFDTMSPWLYPFYILFHPKDGFQEMRMNRKGSLKVAAVIIGCWLFAEIIHRSWTDYDLNPFDVENTSLLRVSIQTLLMYLLACLSNWCFCTLLDGKGRLKDICIAGAYALQPYIIVRCIVVALSWFFVIKEKMLLDYCIVIAEIWTALILIIGLMEIHEYSLKKTLLSLLLTVVGIVIILFLATIIIMMVQQVYFFLATILLELQY